MSSPDESHSVVDREPPDDAPPKSGGSRSFAERHEAEVTRREGEALDLRFDLALGRPMLRERRRRAAQVFGAMPRRTETEP